MTALINFDAMRVRWQAHIARWGGGANFILRRNGEPDLSCVAAVMSYSPQERRGQAVNPEDEKAVISALAPDGVTILREPNRELDTLISLDPDTGVVLYRYRMTAKPQREGSTNARDTVCWTVSVRK